MKRTVIVILLLIFSFTLFTGCTAKTDYVSVEGDERLTVISTVDPFAQHILDGILKNDYSLFTQNFDEQMLKGISQTKFDAIRKSIGSNGGLVDSEITAVETYDEYYRVTYKVTFEKGINLMSIVIPKSGTALVSGLWFK